MTPKSFCDRRRPQAGTYTDHPFGANLRLTIFALPRSVHADEEVGVLGTQAVEDRGVDVDAEGVFLAVLAGGEPTGDGAQVILWGGGD